MSQTYPPLAHETLRLDDIEPGKSESFSPNLYSYLKARGHFYPDGGTPEGVYVVLGGAQPADAYGTGTQMIGFADGDNFVGAPLLDVIELGVEAERMAYPIGRHVVLLRGFWDRYLGVGRCAIDPLHQEQLLDNRYTERGDVRVCKWCGRHQEKVLHPGSGFRVSWMNT
jgi:hypothetical protein